jgi:hypothetical protein
MKRERIQKLIDEIQSIIRDEGEGPVQPAAPGQGYRDAIKVAKLDAAADILRAILKTP